MGTESGDYGGGYSGGRGRDESGGGRGETAFLCIGWGGSHLRTIGQHFRIPPRRYEFIVLNLHCLSVIK
jgi:hypothetical protein